MEALSTNDMYACDAPVSVRSPIRILARPSSFISFFFLCFFLLFFPWIQPAQSVSHCDVGGRTDMSRNHHRLGKKT
ncbi:hypothetical protein QBC45DRAFT_482666 [Copromyces sp. CBS 386.78]|nr:hypothetical protein QBC45DRAFT_482666 [Copromyces sp. CBS 386.78]